jgi:RecA/RadA recombinase
MITELCGPPGAGKSQVCLSASASALLLSLSARRSATSPQDAVGIQASADVIYFDTELKFSVDRLRQILLARLESGDYIDPKQRGGAPSPHSNSSTLALELMSRVIVHRISSLTSSSANATTTTTPSSGTGGLRDLHLLLQRLRDLAAEVPSTGARLVRYPLQRYQEFYETSDYIIM